MCPKLVMLCPERETGRKKRESVRKKERKREREREREREGGGGEERERERMRMCNAPKFLFCFCSQVHVVTCFYVQCAEGKRGKGGRSSPHSIGYNNDILISLMSVDLDHLEI